MTRHLSLGEILSLHRMIMGVAKNASGLRDFSLLESAVAQPRMTFGGADVYPGLVEKAAALGHGLIGNHPFMDGNKRVGHAAMETLLMLAGYEIGADMDEQEKIILAVAAGECNREEFTDWVKKFAVLLSGDR